MIYFLLGIYLAGVVMGLLVVGFGVVLGGRDKALWKIPVYALGWPVAVLALWVWGIRKALGKTNKEKRRG